MADNLAPEPAENVGRGAALALLVLPAGILLWLILWGFGFIASIVALGIAWLAVLLYRRGSGGRISATGAVAVLVIVVVTLVASFFAGMVFDAAKELAQVNDLSAWGAFTHEQFWPTFWSVFPDVLPSYGADFAIAAAFGALGAFSTLRQAFAEGRAERA